MLEDTIGSEANILIPPDNGHLRLDIRVTFDRNHVVTVGTELCAVCDLEETIPSSADKIIHVNVLVHKGLDCDIFIYSIGRDLDIPTLDIVQHLEGRLFSVVVQEVVRLRIL